MSPEIKIPGDLEKTFSEDEKACMIIEPTTFKPKMHHKKLIITTKRVILYKPKLIGHETRDIPLTSITNIEMKKGFVRSTIELHVGHEKIEFEDISNDEANQAISLLKTNAYSQKESHVVIKQQPVATPTQPTEDPIQKLKQLKEMLDAGLVSQEEYDKTKASILSRM